MNARSMLRRLQGRGATTAEDREAVYYLRVTLVVGLSLILGAALSWIPAQPHPFRYVLFLLAYLAGGYRIALDSWEELRRGRLSIDFLMGAAAVGAAIVGSALEGVVLIFLFSLSKALEAHAMGRTRHAIARLMDLRPAEATLADGEGREIGRAPVEALIPGQAILVRPGSASLPTDGFATAARRWIRPRSLANRCRFGRSRATKSTPVQSISPARWSWR